MPDEKPADDGTKTTEPTEAEKLVGAGTTPEGGKPDNGPAGGKEAILADLAKERNARRLAEEKATKLERASMTELEKLKAEFTDASTERDKLRLDNMRLTVGIAAGLPMSMIRRLQGDTLEAMQKDAEELKESLKPADDTKDTRGRKIPNDGARQADGKAKMSANELLRIAMKG